MYDPQLFLYNSWMETADKTLILALTFDPQMTWIPHKRALKDECKRRLNAMKTLAARNRAGDKSTLMLTSQAIIRSKSDRAAAVYSLAKRRHQKSQLYSSFSFTHSPQCDPNYSFRQFTNGAWRNSARKQMQTSYTYACKMAATPHTPIHTIFANKVQKKYDEHQPLSRPLRLRFPQYLKQLDLTIPP
jgi:hypothetical protein